MIQQPEKIFTKQEQYEELVKVHNFLNTMSIPGAIAGQFSIMHNTVAVVANSIRFELDNREEVEETAEEDAKAEDEKEVLQEGVQE